MDQIVFCSEVSRPKFVNDMMVAFSIQIEVRYQTPFGAHFAE
jgi:hypothetical protein